MDISPSYVMDLIEKIENALWSKTSGSKYKYVNNYMLKWHDVDVDDHGYDENFRIFYQKGNVNIDLNKTLHKIEDFELIIKIAIDLGIETQDFIPSIPVFRNKLKVNYKSALSQFSKAMNECQETPSIAIGLANSTLETIIKHILEDSSFSHITAENKTLYTLTSLVLREFNISPDKSLGQDFNSIGSGIPKICQAIENLRSEKTEFHGKNSNAFIIKDSIYAYFVINSVTTVGLFLISFYEKKFKKSEKLVLKVDSNTSSVQTPL